MPNGVGTETAGWDGHVFENANPSVWGRNVWGSAFAAMGTSRRSNLGPGSPR